MRSGSTNLYKGILCILGSALSFALMNVFVRLAGDLPSIEKALFRNLVAFVISLSLLLYQRKKLVFKRKYLPDLILRSIFGTIGVICNFYAVDHLLLADASAIQKLTPFITVLVSALLLKEKIRPYQIICISGAFLASLLIVKPGFDLSAGIAGAVAALGAFGAGTAYVYVRKLSLAGMDRSGIVLFFSAFSIVVLLPLSLLDFVAISPMQLVILLMAGLMASFGQFAVTYAYSFAPAGSISVFDYSQIIFSAFLGFWVFDQIPDAYSFIGYVLIVGFALINTLIFIYRYQGKQTR